MLTQKKLKEELKYNPNTGVFKWRSGKKGVRLSRIAGSYTYYGYQEICVNGVRDKSHRLAWLYVYGYLPENHIDHIDRDRLNNKINNLREVSRQCNMRNTSNQSNNTSGVKGVCWNKKTKKWMATITLNNISKYIGQHKDFLEAVCLRLAVEQSLNWEGCDSSSPAYLYVKENITNERR